MLQEEGPQAKSQDWVQSQQAFNPEDVIFLVCEDELVLGGWIWMRIYAQDNMQVQMNWNAQVREDAPPNILWNTGKGQ